MVKILIVGIGGVGGYFGGLLARSFQSRKNISIYFMARGKNLQAIKQKGLLVTKGDTQFYVYPDIASDDPSDFGKVDYIILCIKSYDIDETIIEINSCVRNDTVFLPLLNGVDCAEKIKAMYPRNLTADGCAYIISRLVEPGHVQSIGNTQSIFFGIQNTEDVRLNFLNNAFKEAGIEAILTKDISAKIWEKFIFISAMATITSYYNKTFGEIDECADCRKDLKQLIDECCAVARHKCIALPAGIKERIWLKLPNLIPEATTSMHSDYLSGKRNTEVRSLTGYIVEEAGKYNLKVPKYQEMYTHLMDH